MSNENTAKQKNIYVAKPSLPPLGEYTTEIEDLWHSGVLSNSGEKHRKLEQQLCSVMDVPHLSLFTNGHLALEAALAAFDMEGEVITTPLTFASTTLAISRSGLTPVFCDVKPNDFTIDPTKIEELITDRTAAIVPVHVYGNICDVTAIDNLAKKYGLKVIYDAAHAFDEKLDGKSVASFGDASMFSFHATKVFNTGEGGAVAYRNPRLKARLESWKNFGLESGDGDISIAGTNAKMSELAAALGLCNLRHLENNVKKRAAVFEEYRKRLAGVCGISLWEPQENVTHNYAYIPIMIDSRKRERDSVLAQMNAQSIFPRKYFYPLTSEHPCFNHLATDSASEATPIAYRASREVLTLPIYADLSFEDIERVCKALLSSLK